MKIMGKNAFLYESAIYLVKKPELFQKADQVALLVNRNL